MKGYWIATYKQIDNLEKLKEYAEKATPIIKEFGGKPIIRGGKYHIIDGDEFIRTVIWEFPSFNWGNFTRYYTGKTILKSFVVLGKVL